MALVNYRFEMPSTAYSHYRLEVVFAIPIEDSAKVKSKSEELRRKAKTPVTRNGTARLAWYAFGTALGTVHTPDLISNSRNMFIRLLFLYHTASGSAFYILREALYASY